MNDKSILQKIRKQALQAGIAVNVSLSNERTCISLNPPLTISHEELTRGLVALEHVIECLHKDEITNPSVLCYTINT